MTSEELLQSTDLQKIADEGSKIYASIKGNYGPEELGKFLAIDIDSQDVFIADTSADAVVDALKAHPGKVFYVVKIGFDATATLAHVYS